VTDLDHPEESKTYTGKELLTEGISIKITDEPGAAVLTYKKIVAGANSQASSAR
jgi:hypothetical protein